MLFKCIFRLFETNEEVRVLFKNLIRGGQFDREHIEDSMEMEKHVRMVMYTLDEAISCLDDMDGVVGTLQAVGSRHKDMKSAGFDPQVFWVSV